MPPHSPRPFHYLQLNLAIIFISTSGALGRFISLPPEVTIFWRSALALPFLLFFLKLTKQAIRPIFRWHGAYFVSALFLGLHWVTYFYSLQWSNVAIAMLSLFTFPVITALLEPFFVGGRLQWRHLILGGLTLMGIYFLMPSFALAATHGPAIGLGIFSALCYALRNLILKRATQAHSGSQLMAIQVTVLSICFVPFLLQHDVGDSLAQWPSLLFLAVFTTVMGHSLFLYSLSHFSVSTASIISSLQPLYGIFIAYVFLKEVPHWGVYLGGCCIVLAVVWESWQTAKLIK